MIYKKNERVKVYGRGSGRDRDKEGKWKSRRME
jgi:hypothetical protein